MTNDALRDLLERSTPEEWLSTLPSMHQQLIKMFADPVTGLTEMDEIWPALSCSIRREETDTKVVTPQAPSPTIKQALRRELHGLICGDPNYEGDWENIRNALPRRDLIVSGVTAFLVQQTGAEVAWVTPFLVVTFVAVARAGVRAWCESQRAVMAKHDATQ